jgi:phosphoesterase RecJ-like protein
MEKTESFKKLIQGSKHIVISTHLFPDADGIGSQIALCSALISMGKNAICVNEEPLLDRYKYLDPQDVVISVDEYKKRDKQVIDLFIIVDTNSPERIGAKAKTTFENAKHFLFIDHHPCAPEIMALHYIDTTKAATGQLVGELIQGLGVPFTKEMALPLYTSILIDTSSFRYPTVGGDTHRLLGALLDTGIRPPNAYNRIYGAKQIAHMRFLGKILSNAQTNHDQTVAWIIIEEDDVELFDSDHEDTHGFINHLLILENIQVACMFRNVGPQIKISFRSVGVVDVGVMAQALGGGGHNHSSATVIEGELSTVISETIEKIELMLKAQ